MDAKMVFHKLPANESFTIDDLRVEIPTHSLLSQHDSITEYVTNNSLLYKLWLLERSFRY